jgi:uncharacterized GH25 family protein
MKERAMTRDRSTARRAWCAAALAAAAAALGLGVATVPAQAHSPYLRPNVFDATKRDHVTVEAAFTEDVFAAEVVMRSDAWAVIGPQGITPITQVTYLRDLAVFEAATPVDGLYRLTSGQRQGRNGRMYQAANGDWKMVGEEDEAPPPGAAIVEVQSLTTADAYVVRGAPGETASAPALKASGEGLELTPLLIPTDIVAGEAAVFRVTFDGRPLAGQAVTVFREAGRYDGRKIAVETTTDAEGRLNLTLTEPGAYMTLIRHRTEAPAGAPTPYRSYSHTLTFAVQAD